MLIHLAQSYWMKPGGAQSVLSPTQQENIFLPLHPVEGRGLESVTLPPLPFFKLTWIVWEGREKGWITISFSFPLLSFLPLTYSICFSSGAPPVLGVWCSNLPARVTSRFLQSQLTECSVLSNSSIVSQVWLTLRVDFILKAERRTMFSGVGPIDKLSCSELM